MREICTSGSVGGEGGNLLAYPAAKSANRAAHIKTHFCKIPCKFPDIREFPCADRFALDCISHWRLLQQNRHGRNLPATPMIVRSLG